MTGKTSVSFRTSIKNKQFLNLLVEKKYFRNVTEAINSAIEDFKRKYRDVWEEISRHQ